MFNKFPKRTGIYHIKDSIEHLEIKIIFKHINSLLRLPKFDYNKSISNGWPNRENLNNENSNDATEIKEVRIKWQEKLFSAVEKELLKELKNCITDVQKKYYDWLLAKNEADDLFETEKSMEKSRRRRKKQRSKSDKIKKRMHQQQKIYEIHTYTHEDNFQPEENDIKVKSANNTQESAVNMYIYASFDIETQLAHLQWHPKERMLYIYPDFNSFSHNPYFIEIDKDYRHLYAYAVENISKARASFPRGELGLFLEIPELKPHWRTEKERNSLFAMPPKRTKRCSLLLELGEALNFENDNIHVRYYVHIPENTIHEDGLLEASTHASSMSDSGIHHFGYNWQLIFLCEENFDAANFLHIYFEVISIDSWERERIEGYAFYGVNLASPKRLERIRLHCLRPIESLIGSLKRFFIGGRGKFDYVRFFGQEKTVTTKPGSELHCLYGNQMQNTGVLEFSCQIFTQRNCELLEPCAQRKSGMTLDDIMLAYREARKRLEALTLK